MAFFDSSWVSASVNASFNTFAALGATNSLIGNPLAQSGYANIMNGINNAIRFGQASASLPQPQRLGTIGTLDVGDQVNASRTIAIPIELRTRRIFFYLRKIEFLMTCKKIK